MGPGLVSVLVVHELEQVLWHAHLARAYGFALGDAWGIHRTGDDIHVASGPASVFFRGRLDRDPPGAPVVLGRLGHHVGQRKALRHGARGRHVARWRQMALVVSAAFVVAQCCPFGRRQARVREKPVFSLLMGLCDQRAVELFGNKNGGLALARMQDRKSVVAQGTLQGPRRDHGRLAAGEKLRAGRKVLADIYRACCG